MAKSLAEQFGNTSVPKPKDVTIPVPSSGNARPVGNGRPGNNSQNSGAGPTRPSGARPGSLSGPDQTSNPSAGYLPGDRRPFVNREPAKRSGG